MPDTFLSLYTSYCSEITDASPDYHVFIGMGIVGALLGNKVFMPWGDGAIYPNIWLILLGESTWSRKSTSLNIAKKLLDQYNSSKIYPNEFSYESLVREMSERPAGCFFHDEFSNFASVLNREYMSGAKGFLAHIFDSPYKFERKLSNTTYKIDHPAPCMFSGTNPKWFIENLKESDLEGGLIPRFIIVPNARKGTDMPRPPMACKEKRGLMLEYMREIEAVRGAAYLTDEAGDLFDMWYKKIRNLNYNGVLLPFVGRLQAYIIKFAMIAQVNQNLSLKITPGIMKDSIHLADWLRKRLEDIEKDEIVFGKTNKDIQKIRKQLKGEKDGVGRADLLRNTHLSKWEFNRAIETMIDGNQVEETEKLTPGEKKKATWYKLI